MIRESFWCRLRPEAKNLFRECILRRYLDLIQGIKQAHVAKKFYLKYHEKKNWHIPLDQYFSAIHPVPELRACRIDFVELKRHSSLQPERPPGEKVPPHGQRHFAPSVIQCRVDFFFHQELGSIFPEGE